ncbi:GNAT family N-acetyltransferase [Actinopolymorpha alba]|uniref:GNAT family N-acetyltransferase n=1 Tax=Actinopolymorpha alba TaxID=533267 RepID=UPI0012F6544E|nr:GNAT family N-acetyltransferase [Actinopolymorpha alba]
MATGSLNFGVRATRRLRLEPIGPEHAHDLWRLHQDPVVVAWYAGAWSFEEAEAFGVESRRLWNDDGVGKWMAYLHDGTLVGRGGLSRTPEGASTTTQIQRLVKRSWSIDRFEIGWALLSEFHGQGYAAEIGREGLTCAEQVLGGTAVISFTERHNVPSRRVMKRIGMTYAGEILWRGLASRVVARTLEFWPDYGSGPLWDNEGRPVDLDELDLPGALIERIPNWHNRYEEARLPMMGLVIPPGCRRVAKYWRASETRCPASA